MTWGGAEINYSGGAREVYLYEIRGGHGGARSLFECGSNEKGEDQKKKDLRPKSFIKSGVSPQKLRKNSSCSRIPGR